MSFADVVRDGKTTGKVPCVQFILDRDRQIFVIGVNFDDLGGVQGGDVRPLNEELNIKTIPKGRLFAQDEGLKGRIRYQLCLANWNFELWPNPEIILLERLW